MITRRRLALTVGIAALLAGLAFALSLLVGVQADASGARHLAILDVGRALRVEDSMEAQIFFFARLPRSVAAALAGAGLAAAGVAFQAVLRNPLAEPFTLGVSSGASFGAVIAIRLGVEAALGTSSVAAFAFAGALMAVFIVWRVARVGNSRPPAILLLAGVTIAFTCSAGSMFVQYTASFAESYRIVRWMMGGLDWVPWTDLVRSTVVVGGGLLALLWVARDLNALAAGGDAAASVGVPVDRTVAVAYLAASAIVGAIVAFAGPIGFIGIVVPHLLRGIVGPDHRVLLPTAIFIGAGFLTLADTLARTIISPAQMPVGIITAVVGGPFFIAVLLGEKKRPRLWSAGP